MSVNPSLPGHLSSDTVILAAVNAWEVYLKDQYSSLYTIKAFLSDLRLFANFLPADRGVGAVTTNEINRFLKWLEEGRNVPCSAKSLSRRITSLKAFFRWLQRYGIIAGDPAEKIVQHSVTSPLPEVLTIEEMDAVLKAAAAYMAPPAPKKGDTRPYALLGLLLATGIKKGECLAISPNHIDLSEPETPFIFIRYANVTTRFKERKIFLPQEWVEVYPQYLEQYQPDDKLFPWSARRLEYLLEDIGKAASLEKRLSFDACRWSCALKDWKEDVDKDKIRQKLGISKIQWREIRLKLRTLAGENVEEESDGEAADSPDITAGENAGESPVS